MYRFEYEKPGSLADAAAAGGSDDAQYLAGGMTLLPAMKLRLSSPARLVSLSGIPDLAGISATESRIAIRAMTTHADVARDPVVRERCPALAHLAGLIGDAQVRNRGTLGGSLATNHPSADYPAAALALDAEIITDRATHDAADFFDDLFTTTLEPGEIITEATFRIADAAAYEKFPDPASRYALTGVFVARFGNDVRVAVTGAAGSVFRFTAAEAALSENFAPESLAGVTCDSADLLEDLHATAEYRAHLVGILTRRAAARAVAGS